RATGASVTAPRSTDGKGPTDPKPSEGRGRVVAPSRLEPPAGAAVTPSSSILDEPALRGGPAPMSQTVWTGGGGGIPARAPSEPAALGGDGKPGIGGRGSGAGASL